MGKRLPKSELLKEIAAEKVKLAALLDQLSPRQMTRGDVTKAGWSVKDILGHLIGWQQMNLRWHGAALLGETPEVPAPGLSWKDIHIINDKIYRQHRKRSLKDVVADHAKYHDEMIDLIDSVSDRDLVTLGRYDWTGNSWTLSDYIRANTASHYRWACKHIRRWARDHDA